MRVLLLSRYGRMGASSRLRSYQYLPYLEARGFEVTVAPLLNDDYLKGLYRGRAPLVSMFSGYCRRLWRLLTARQYDLVWIEKEALPWLPAWVELALLPRGVPVLVDYDDALFHRYDLHRSGTVRRLLGDKINKVMRRADLVVVGNTYIAEHARRAGARRVEELPTAVDLERYSVAVAPVQQPLTIGWIGTPSTSSYLSTVAGALSQLVERSGARIKLVGAGTVPITAPVDRVPWTEETEVSEIQHMDIGIMPLPDEPWERGKCGYKLIQYMACSKPVVASPVGVNADIVSAGSNGYLASAENEWIESLEMLCANPELRRSMGAAGRHLVETRYSTQVTAPRLESLLRSVSAV